MLWVRCLTFLCQCFLTHKRQVTLVLTSNDVLKLSDCLEVRMQQLKASSASVSLTQGAHPFLLHLKWVHLTPAVAFPVCVPPSVCLHICVPPRLPLPRSQLKRRHMTAGTSSVFVQSLAAWPRGSLADSYLLLPPFLSSRSEQRTKAGDLPKVAELVSGPHPTSLRPQSPCSLHLLYFQVVMGSRSG